jgi:hypothetical protein
MVYSQQQTPLNK